MDYKKDEVKRPTKYKLTVSWLESTDKHWLDQITIYISTCWLSISVLSPLGTAAIHRLHAGSHCPKDIWLNLLHNPMLPCIVSFMGLWATSIISREGSLVVSWAGFFYFSKASIYLSKTSVNTWKRQERVAGWREYSSAFLLECSKAELRQVQMGGSWWFYQVPRDWNIDLQIRACSEGEKGSKFWTVNARKAVTRKQN